jgi:hypothetical protein
MAGSYVRTPGFAEILISSKYGHNHSPVGAIGLDRDAVTPLSRPLLFGSIKNTVGTQVVAQEASFPGRHDASICHRLSASLGTLLRSV